MLMEHILKIHEDSLYGSLDYSVSEFILLNAYDMDQFSLGDIARELNLSKSSVASFFSSSRLSGGYPLFLRSLRTDLGRSSITLNVYTRQLRAFLNRSPRHLRPESPEIFDRISEEIFRSRKVIFLGPKRLRESISPIESLLWRKRIVCRYIMMASAVRYADELSSLSDDDLVILISPHDNFREFNYYINSFPYTAKAIENTRGRHLYLLSDPAGSEEDRRIITVPSNSNLSELSPSADIFMSRLFLACAQHSGLDSTQQLYIL